MSESNPTRLERLEGNEKKKKAIVSGIIVLLVALFVGGVFLGLYSLLQTEETVELDNAELQCVTALPDTDEQAISYFKSLMENSKDFKKTKIKYSTSAEVKEESIVDNADDAYLDEALKYIRTDVASRAAQLYGSYEAKFGEDYSSELINTDFTSSDLVSVKCTDSEENELRYLDFVFKDAPYPLSEVSTLYRCFATDKIPDIAGELRTELSDFCTITDSDITCSGFMITVAVDRYTDKISYIDYIRNYDVEMELSFGKWPLEQLGTRRVAFEYSAKQAYTFTWAGLRLGASVLWLEKGDSQMLEAFRTADEDLTVSWSSSDESVATIDEDGYVSGEANSEKPATITASVEYLGTTYTESCTVYVRKPVSHVDLSSETLEIKAGKTATLNVSFKPKKATVQTVYWFTEDEKIATVDDNGTVTAVSPGQTVVYAVSLDGNLKAPCTVTVK